MNWIALQNSEQLSQLISESKIPDKFGVLVFKHSTRCSISNMALSRLERKWNYTTEKLSTYYLDLLNYRELSSKIENIFSIEHQSPQILLIQNGICTFSRTHSDIDVLEIENFIGRTTGTES